MRKTQLRRAKLILDIIHLAVRLGELLYQLMSWLGIC